MPPAVRSLSLSLLISLIACAGVRDNSLPFINQTSMGGSAFQTAASADAVGGKTGNRCMLRACKGLVEAERCARCETL